jgi:phenylacetate-CoA ligase
MEDIERLSQDRVSETIAEPLLRQQLQRVLERSTFYQEKTRDYGIGGRDPALVDAFADFPFTEKAELLAEQERYPPYGRLALEDPVTELSRIHITSGSSGKPLYVALSHSDVEATRIAGRRAFRCAGLTPQDSVVHCLNYCLWAGGVSDHLALEATGATVIPFGVGNTKRLLETIRELRPTAISCTPSYMARLEIVLREEFGLEPHELGLGKAFFGGEGGLQNPRIRGRIEETWQMRAIDANYGMSDVLSIFGAECDFRQGLHFHGQEHLYVELIDPETDRPVPLESGRFGELVLTNLTRQAQPLLRYRTKDVIRILATDECLCGRSSFRFEVAGRTDEMIVVRGVNVYPTAVRNLLAEHKDRFSGEFQVVLTTPPPIDRPLLRVEVLGDGWQTDAALLEAFLVQLCHSRLSFTPDVELLPVGGLPRTEGKSKYVVRAYEGSR